jgi:hypothetical protein
MRFSNCSIRCNNNCSRSICCAFALAENTDRRMNKPNKLDFLIFRSRTSQEVSAEDQKGYADDQEREPRP